MDAPHPLIPTLCPTIIRYGTPRYSSVAAVPWLKPSSLACKTTRETSRGWSPEKGIPRFDSGENGMQIVGVEVNDGRDRGSRCQSFSPFIALELLSCVIFRLR